MSPFSTNQLLLIGNYGAGNLGDDAILTGLVHEIRSLGFEGEILVTSGAVKTASKVYREVSKVPFAAAGLRSWWKNGSRIPLEWKNVQKAIIGGGGLFVDEESWRAPWIWQAQAKALQKSNIPYAGFGQSIGSLKPWNKWAFRKTLLQARSYHLRDHHSFERTKNELKIDKEELRLKVQQGTDFALHLPVHSEEKLLAEREPIALIHLREWPAYSRAALRELYNDLANQITDRGLKPILITLDPHNAKELDFLRQLSSEIFIPNSVEACLEAFQKARLTVGMRLHGTLLSAHVKTPTVAISYSEKVADILNQWNDVPLLKDPKHLVFPNAAPSFKNAHLLEVNRQSLKGFLFGESEPLGGDHQ